MHSRWPQHRKAVMLTGVFLLCATSAAGQAFDRALCRDGLKTQRSVGSTLPRFDGQEVEFVVCETAGDTNGAPCPSPEPAPGRIGVSLSSDGPFLSELRVTATIGNCGPGCVVGPMIYVKGLNDGETRYDSCPTTNAFAFGCLGRGPGIYRVHTVDTLTLEGPDVDANPGIGGGLRIFPGKQTPSDTADHREVMVKATTNAGPPVLDPDVFIGEVDLPMVTFRSIDMDDPTTDAEPVDPNMDEGNDNRGTPKMGQLLGTRTVEVPANSEAAIPFRVTMQPGDNFKVVAGCDQTYVNGIQSKGQKAVDINGDDIEVTKLAKGSELLTVWRRLHLEVDEMGIVTGNRVTGTIQEVKSVTGNQAILVLTDLLDGERNVVHDADRFENGLLTVDGLPYQVVKNGSNKGDKETVTILVPALPLPTMVGKPFTLVDDDDHNENNGLALIGDMDEKVVRHGQVFSFMKDSDDPSSNAFAKAFIKPIYDGAGGTDESMTDFALNIEGTADLVDLTAPVLNPIFRQSVGDDDYWVGYFQIGYQGKLAEDADPLSEGRLLFGLTGSDSREKSRNTLPKSGPPTGGFGSIVFMEAAKEGPNLGLPEEVMNSTAAHEMGHQFGLAGHGGKGAFGIMSLPSGDNLSGGRPSYEFVDDHLNILRSRVKTPGAK